MKKLNFYSGPAILPRSVMEKAAQAILDFNDSGLSILEISHRSSAFQDIMDGAQTLVRELYQLPTDYEVLFMTGGASTQFPLIPYNLLPQDGTAAYLETGQWAENAIKEARLFGNVAVVASSRSSNFSYIPKQYTLPTNATYFHITTNNTIYGTQLHTLPNSHCPIIADMSSDIFSRPFNATQCGIIYAGAQKNMGAAGTTLVIIRKDLLNKTNRQIPTMFNYQTHINKGSMFNTPPVFAVYVSYLTLLWIKERGLDQIGKDNQTKADTLYTEIDRNSLFHPMVTAPEDRSQMNVTFRCTKPQLEQDFLQLATQNNCIGIKGYRTVGGFRASLYNAMDITGTETLVQLMQHFEHQFA